MSLFATKSGNKSNTGSIVNEVKSKHEEELSLKEQHPDPWTASMGEVMNQDSGSNPMASLLNGGQGSNGAKLSQVDTPAAVQAKLEIGEPGDQFEQEADETADRVMTMPAPEISLTSPDKEDNPDISMKSFLQMIQKQGTEDQEEEGLSVQQKPILQMLGEDEEQIQEQTEEKEETPDISKKEFLQMVADMDKEEKVQMIPGIQKQEDHGKWAEREIKSRETLFSIGKEIQIANDLIGKMSAMEIAKIIQTENNIEDVTTIPVNTILKVPTTGYFEERAGETGAEALPSIASWELKTVGSTSDDNICTLCPANLGVNSESPHFKNGIELKAIITNHIDGYTYDIKRTREGNSWKRNGENDVWTEVSSDSAGTVDDIINTDEYLTPTLSGSNHHIYSIDAPGFSSGSASGNYTDKVQIRNFTEFVRITRPDGSTYDVSTIQQWHSIVWIAKSGSGWSMDESKSEIGTGHLTSFDPQ